MIRQIDSSQVSSVLSFSNLGGATPPGSARLQVVTCIRIQKVKEVANICQILYSVRSKMQALHGTIFNSLIYFPPLFRLSSSQIIPLSLVALSFTELQSLKSGKQIWIFSPVSIF